MPIPVISNLEPSGLGGFPTHLDSHGKGGYQSVASTAARDAIPALNRKQGMLVFVIDISTFYRLEADLSTWTIVPLAGDQLVQAGPTIPSPVDANGKVLFSDGTNYVLRYITTADIRDFAISSFNATGGLLYETGATVTTPAFTATYSTPPTAGTLTDSDNNIAQNISGSLGSFSSTYSFMKTTNNASVTFSLFVSDLPDTDTAVRTVYWRPPIWAGTGTSAPTLNQAFLESLPLVGLLPSRACSFTCTVGSGQRAWFAMPLGYGAATFTIPPFDGGFIQDSNVVVTRNAVVQTYQVWKSVNEAIGTNTITVS